MRLKALLDKASTHLNENSRFSAIVSNPRKMLRTPPFHRHKTIEIVPRTKNPSLLAMGVSTYTTIAADSGSSVFVAQG